MNYQIIFINMIVLICGVTGTRISVAKTFIKIQMFPLTLHNMYMHSHYVIVIPRFVRLYV